MDPRVHDSLSDDKPKEECGVFGVFNNSLAANLTYLGLHSLQHRGQESAGIATSDGEHIYRYTGMGKVGDVFTEDKIKHLKGDIAVGHNRYSTTGSSFLRNAQPLHVDSRLGPIVIAHNGNLVNTPDIRSRLSDMGHLFQTSIDSEVIVHLMAKSGLDNFKEALIYALVQIKGAYSLLTMNKDHLYAVRDPHGLRPLVLGKLDESYVVASETCAFDIIGADYIRDVEPGELIEITSTGIKSMFPFPKVEHAHCIFEYIYFSRPDSYVFGNSVYDMRVALGKQLAKERPVEADAVIAIPDSSNCAALGYSRESGIPYEMGMMRSHYVGRTFIEPTQKIRDFGAKLKYNVIKSAVEGKRVILVDDSIMRGTTMKKIIKMFRRAGATEVHVRISSPPVKFPCFYGIDIPTRQELIASSSSVEEIENFLQVDSLAYLTVDTMLKAVSTTGLPYCTACFDGQYPIDFQESSDNKKFAFEDMTNEYY